MFSIGGAAGLSFDLRLSALSVSAGFDGAGFVTAEEGGTEALGATLSRCLSFPLSRVSAGVVPGAIDAAGVPFGETFSSRLLFSLSGVIAAVAAGVTDAATLGAGEISRFLSLSLPLSLAGETLALTAGLAEAAGAVVAGLAPVAGAALAAEVAGADAAGLAAVSSRAAFTVGGGTVFGSSFFIFSFSSVSLASATGAQPRSTEVWAIFSFTTFGAIGFEGFTNCCGAATTSLSPWTFMSDFERTAASGSTFVSRCKLSRWIGRVE